MSVTTTNEWPQVQMPGNHSNLFQPQQSPSDPTVGQPMDATVLQQQQQQQTNLKCPRCDSSNTKFCYYNNYSLSQPRHFCKACKRYWTRGGTLRNVPVGGGCRKNKRIKKNTNSNTHMNSGTTAPVPVPPMISDSTTVDPMVYNFHNADLNLPAFLKRSFGEPYDHFRPHNNNNNMGLCFPIISNTITTPQFPSLLEQSSASTSLVHDYSLLGSSLSSSTAASLLAATLRQPRTTGFSSEWPVYDDLHGNGNIGPFFKEIKVDEDGNRLGHREEWNVGQVNPSENVVGDNGLMYWNSSVIGWPDGANCGSSVTPLI